MPGAANYDLHAALYQYAPGVVLTAPIEAALGAQYVANGYAPLTQSQVVAIASPLPDYPDPLPRFADSNPDPKDGWSIERSEAFP